MRRSRRGGGHGMEFGGSGEDSFVAVVVTKLTGALLFILLLTMVIMALIPKAIDAPRDEDDRPSPGEAEALEIATPETLPEAIAGRPYVLALAATGGRGPLRWAVDGPVPEGLELDPDSGQLRGTPKAGTPGAVELILRVSDGADRATRPARLVVYQPDGPLMTPSRLLPGLPPIAWRAWLEEGFGFLLLMLVHVAGMGGLAAIERWSAGPDPDPDGPRGPGVRRRFLIYRNVLRSASLSAAVGLAAWMWLRR